MARVIRAPADESLSFPWWSWLPRRRFRVIGVVDAADLIPDRLPRKGMVVVENRNGRLGLRSIAHAAGGTGCSYH